MKNTLLTGPTCITVLLTLLALATLSSCNRSKPQRAAAPTATPPAPLINLPPNVVDTELRAVSGAPIKLSNYAGKVYLVNLWATWCGPCRHEAPELSRLYTQFRPQGLEVVGLSTEEPEASTDAVKRFLQEFDVNYRVGWTTPELAATLMQGRDAIPQSFIISRNGRIVKRFIGFDLNTTPPLLKEAIQEALNEQPGS